MYSFKNTYKPLEAVFQRRFLLFYKTKSTNRYQFGFNGQLKDNEIYGEGNAYTAEFWEYDPRSIRRWNVDPLNKNYPHLSPYSTHENNPIFFRDSDGMDGIYSIKGNTITISSKIYIVGDGATDQKAVEIQSSIMQKWGKKFTYTDDKGKVYNVKFDIVVESVTKDNYDLAFRDVAYGSANVAVLTKDPNFRSDVDAIYGKIGRWYNNSKTATYPHETGHFLKLKDLYYDDFYARDPTGMPGKGKYEIISKNYSTTEKDDLMGVASSNNPSISKVKQSSINAIVEYILEDPSAIKKKDGSVTGVISGGIKLNGPSEDVGLEKPAPPADYAD